MTTYELVNSMRADGGVRLKSKATGNWFFLVDGGYVGFTPDPAVAWRFAESAAEQLVEWLLKFGYPVEVDNDQA